MRTVDLRHFLEGHVVLWCKGWYGSPHDAERFSEVWAEWCGMSGQITAFNLLRIMFSTITQVGVNNDLVSDILMRVAAEENGRMTLYQVKLEDDISMRGLVEALSRAIACCTMRDDKIEVLLPKRLPGIKTKYALHDREGE